MLYVAHRGREHVDLDVSEPASSVNNNNNRHKAVTDRLFIAIALPPSNRDRAHVVRSLARPLARLHLCIGVQKGLSRCGT